MPRGGQKSSLYVGVGWSPRHSKWYARDGCTGLGLFDDESAAAEAMAAHRGVPAMKLVSPAAQIQLFSIWHQAWTSDNLLPCDLEATIERAHLHQPMYSALPALEVWSLQGKFGPWKDALWEAWEAADRPTEQHFDSKEALGSALANILRDATMSYAQCPPERRDVKGPEWCFSSSWVAKWWGDKSNT